MITLTCTPDTLDLDVRGADKLWSLKSKLSIPLAHVRQVRIDDAARLHWLDGIKAPGTHVPGVIAAGTFYRHGRKLFADIREGQPALVIELRDDRYDELIIQTQDVQGDLIRVRAALAEARA